jgi:hypothetical protein
MKTHYLTYIELSFLRRPDPPEFGKLGEKKRDRRRKLRRGKIGQ